MESCQHFTNEYIIFMIKVHKYQPTLCNECSYSYQKKSSVLKWVYNFYIVITKYIEYIHK